MKWRTTVTTKWRTLTNEEANQNEQQQHKNLAGGSPKQSNIARSFWLLILKNDYRINYKKKWL